MTADFSSDQSRQAELAKGNGGGGKGSEGSAKTGGVEIERFFTQSGQDPYAEIEWEKRTAEIRDGSGHAVFRQEDAEVPKSWSQLAVDVVVSKYFRGKIGDPEREHSVAQLVHRVVDTIAAWGKAQEYFVSDEETLAFRDELAHMCLHQRVSFNSPVWFNCGAESKPQCSACFINSLEDTMGSILELAKTEGMLFKYGSGSGTNFSPLRSSQEILAGGGTASGPVSFMRGFDAFAGVIKSGGRTRRAAKMVILNIDHPDVVEFIGSKAREEKKAWALIDAGYDGGFNVTGGAYESITFQNANHSVRLTDEFMSAVEKDGYWETKEVLSDKPADRYKARDLMEMICEAAHICGDPGLQFDTTVNKWNPCKNSGRINASNPCSEYMFLDDSACNLASLNLMQFQDEDGEFDTVAFRHAVDVIITAMDIIVDNAGYPSDRIARNSHMFRPLGLGYANLGALLMSKGIPYDSDAGRDLGAAITALMTGEAYAQSARLAEKMEPFEAFPANREPMLEVIEMHRDSLAGITPQNVPGDLLMAATDAWNNALALGREMGIRNAQASVLAPTGTIGFMMDCDTTGIEPDLALVKRKKMVGGGVRTYVNQTAPLALERLGYDQEQIREILSYMDEHDTIEGAPYLEDEHLPVFDCAFRPLKGTRSIHRMGHVRMMGAVQPFISGAISKTVNMPEDATPEDIKEVYMESWKLGLKAITVYRDGCKRSQPLQAGKSTDSSNEGATGSPPKFSPIRRRLPDERRAVTHKFDIAGHEGYITCGMFEDGSCGEIFLLMAKEGSVVSGLMDSFATAISLALQYGVPLEALINKFTNAKFDPSGFTKNREIPVAKSVVDYIFRWMALKFLSPEKQAGLGLHAKPSEKDNPGMGSLEHGLETDHKVVTHPSSQSVQQTEGITFRVEDDAPPCSDCGAIMVRNGSCYRCINCGSTSGCS